MGIDLKQTQMDLEELFSNNHLIPRLRSYFGTEAVESHCKTHGIIPAFGVDVLVQMWLHKRAGPGVILGILAHHTDDQEEPLQAAADQLELCVAHDLVDMDCVTGLLIVRHYLDEQVARELELFQYPLPMVIEPKTLTHNDQSAYYTIKQSVILAGQHHDDDVWLGHLNRVNSIPLSVDKDIVDNNENVWKGIDTKQPGESDYEHERRVKQFTKFNEVSRDVVEHLLISGNKFYMTNRYDKRGRTYSQGYHINPQGNDFQKAIVCFHKAERLAQ